MPGVDEAEGPIERVAALRRHLRGTYRQVVLMELIEVEAAEGGVDLILNADVFLEQVSFGVDRALEEIELCDRATAQECSISAMNPTVKDEELPKPEFPGKSEIMATFRGLS